MLSESKALTARILFFFFSISPATISIVFVCLFFVCAFGFFRSLLDERSHPQCKRQAILRGVYQSIEACKQQLERTPVTGAGRPSAKRVRPGITYTYIYVCIYSTCSMIDPQIIIQRMFNTGTAKHLLYVCIYYLLIFISSLRSWIVLNYLLTLPRNLANFNIKSRARPGQSRRFNFIIVSDISLN